MRPTEDSPEKQEKQKFITLPLSEVWERGNSVQASKDLDDDGDDGVYLLNT